MPRTFGSLRAYEPGLMDKARWWMQDTLTPAFGGDAKAAGAYVNDKIMPTAEWLSGIGDAMAAGDAVDYFKQGSPMLGSLSALGAAVGLVPGVGDVAQKGIKSLVKSRGDDVLGMLKSGRASEVTDDMLDLGNAADNANLNAYLYDNYDLPMDTPSRMNRAQEMVFGDDYYHGTTHDFNQFGGNTGNLEGHFGAGNYLTSSRRDASANYAGEGPDLTGRITQRAEQLNNEMDLNFDDPKGFEQAKSELKGSNEGFIIPARVRGKTVDTQPHTRGQPTVLENDLGPYSTDDFIEDAKNELGSDADSFEIQARASEIAWEENQNLEPEGELAKFIQAIRDAGWKNDFDAEEALTPIIDSVYEGVASANDLDRSLRGGSLMYAENPNSGVLIGNDVIRQAFNSAGYPNIVMDAASSFGNMKNIPEGTKHIINSAPENIRSQFARFDPRLKHLRNLSAGIGGLGLLGANAFGSLAPQQAQAQSRQHLDVTITGDYARNK